MNEINLNVSRGSFFKLYSSISVLLGSSLILAVPNGHSVGAILLLLGGAVFLLLSFLGHPVNKVSSFDTNVFIIFLVAYFGLNIALNYLHDLPVRSFDLPSRFILFIPIFLFLLHYPPNKRFLWLGISVGAILSGAIAAYQQFSLMPKEGGEERANGFLNAIQFGDISMLLACLILCHFCFRPPQKNLSLISAFFIFSIACGILGSLLSKTRGGWIVFPLSVFIIYILSDSEKRKYLRKIFLAAAIFCLAITFLMPAKYNFLAERAYRTSVEIRGVLDGDKVGGYTEYTSLSVRIKLWKNGLQAFYDKPIIGWGSVKEIKEHHPAGWDILKYVDDFNHYHNEVVDTLAKKGLFGLSGLIALYLIPFIHFSTSIRNLNASNIDFAIAGIVLVISTMVFGFTQCFFAHSSGVMVYLYFLVLFYSAVNSYKSKAEMGCDVKLET
ncbi:O-antigen ligase family protein [Cellvibrio sp.]|uniref:O-antigen ligase family protein n=1 Tax=Cellvibrio sp. TaxID=1965322 RepID=UPI003964757A